METSELNVKIEGENYYVQSYGQEEFIEFWDKYYHPEKEDYVKVYGVFLYDMLQQLNVFEKQKNFIFNFEAGRFTVLNTWIYYMCEELYGVMPSIANGFHVRIIGSNINDTSQVLKMQLIPSNSETTFNFVLDNFGSVPPEKNTDFIAVPSGYMNEIVTNEIKAKKIVVNNSEFVGERNRAIIAYNGTSYMHTEQSITLALDGYETGQIEKVIFKFSEYDTANHVGMNKLAKTYVIDNNSSNDIFDGFYNTNTCVFSTSDKSFGNQMITKSFNLDTDGKLSGYSSNDSLANKIVLRSVTVIIDQKYWGKNIITSNRKNYPLINTSEISTDEKEVYMVDGNMAVNIYSMTEKELENFKREYKNKN